MEESSSPMHVLTKKRKRGDIATMTQGIKTSTSPEMATILKARMNQGLIKIKDSLY